MNHDRPTTVGRRLAAARPLPRVLRRSLAAVSVPLAGSVVALSLYSVADAATTTTTVLSTTTSLCGLNTEPPCPTSTVVPTSTPGTTPTTTPAAGPTASTTTTTPVTPVTPAAVTPVTATTAPTTTIGVSDHRTIKLPTFYAFVTTEGTQACHYLPGSTVTTLVTSPTSVTSGPNLTAAKNGCVTVAVLYIDTQQFEFLQGKNSWTAPYLLGYGTNSIVLTGQNTGGGPLVTTVLFGLGLAGSNAGLATSIHSKGVPWLDIATILALLADLLLLGTGLYLYQKTRPTFPEEEEDLTPSAADDDEEEEGDFDDLEAPEEPAVTAASSNQPPPLPTLPPGD